MGYGREARSILQQIDAATNIEPKGIKDMLYDQMVPVYLMLEDVDAALLMTEKSRADVFSRVYSLVLIANKLSGTESLQLEKENLDRELTRPELEPVTAEVVASW